MKPTSITWNIGRDKHKRDVLLHHRNGEWMLEALAVNQRDEGERMFSLTAEVLIAAGEIARDWKP